MSGRRNAARTRAVVQGKGLGWKETWAEHGVGWPKCNGPKPDEACGRGSRQSSSRSAARSPRPRGHEGLLGLGPQSKGQGASKGLGSGRWLGPGCRSEFQSGQHSPMAVSWELECARKSAAAAAPFTAWGAAEARASLSAIMGCWCLACSACGKAISFEK